MNKPSNIIECERCEGLGVELIDAEYGEPGSGQKPIPCTMCDGECFVACEWCDESTGECLYCEVQGG